MIVDEYHYTLYTKGGKDRKKHIFYYSFKDEDGKWQKRSTGCTTERKARAYVNKLIAEGSFRDTPVSKNLTFREFAEKYRFWVYDECPIVRDAIARKGHYSKENCKSKHSRIMMHQPLGAAHLMTAADFEVTAKEMARTKRENRIREQA